MNRDTFRNRLTIGACGAAIMWAGIVAGTAPARAFDDKPSSFDPILNFVGLGKDSDEKPDIDFRERPKLVVPKTADLPPPQPAGSGRSANWPVDQDVARRRAAQQAERAPRVINPKANPILDHDEIMRGRAVEAEKSQELCDTKQFGVPDCSALTPADKLKQVFSLGPATKTDEVRPGTEPSREYLTEPPKGYRAATTVTRDVKREPNRPYESPSAGDYVRGVDPNRTSGD
jgi:hypothetical protein